MTYIPAEMRPLGVIRAEWNAQRSLTESQADNLCVCISPVWRIMIGFTATYSEYYSVF